VHRGSYLNAEAHCCRLGLLVAAVDIFCVLGNCYVTPG
jgi:hypothetical protein